MKKAKNILLLVANMYFVVYFVRAMARFFIELSSAQDEGQMIFIVTNRLYPALVLLLLLVLPVWVLVRNLKGKQGKVIPILSITVYSVLLAQWLFTACAPAVPQYLVYSKLGLIDTYCIHVMFFLGEGGWWFLAGYLCVIIGSVLSLPKRQKKEEIL